MRAAEADVFSSHNASVHPLLHAQVQHPRIAFQKPLPATLGPKAPDNCLAEARDSPHKVLVSVIPILPRVIEFRIQCNVQEEMVFDSDLPNQASCLHRPLGEQVVMQQKPPRNYTYLGGALRAKVMNGFRNQGVEAVQIFEHCVFMGQLHHEVRSVAA
eukprot:5924094-Lingulodinium_polyedra.AAC.1